MRRPRHRLLATLVAAVLAAAPSVACSEDGRTLRPPPTTLGATTAPPTALPPTTLPPTALPPTTLPPTTLPAPAPIVARVCAGAASVAVVGPLPGDFPEISGLAASRAVPGSYWAIQDSGNPAELVALDPAAGTFRRVALEGVANLDWEDLAIDPAPGGGPSELWVADIGDNFTFRRRVSLHHVVEPAPTEDAVEPRTIEATFEDGPRDAEALFVFDGVVWLIEKTDSGASGVYRLDTTVFRRVGEIDVHPAVVTGADIAADGTVAVRTNQSVLVYAGLGSVGGAGSVSSVEATLQGEPCVAPAPPEGQGESITFTRGADALVTVSELGGSTTVDVHQIG